MTREVCDRRERRRVHIREAKAAKERYLPLREATLHELRAWWRTRRHPKWVFPGIGRGWREQPVRVAHPADAVEPMSVGSVQHCLRPARAEAGRLPATPRVYSISSSEVCCFLRGSATPSHSWFGVLI